MKLTPHSIIDYWLDDVWRYPQRLKARAQFWWNPTPAQDKQVEKQFKAHLEPALQEAYNDWLVSAEGYLALIILLDQVPRNCFRNSSKAFQYDNKARELTKLGLQQGFDQQLNLFQRVFFYLPLEHDEDTTLQQLSVQNFAILVDAAPATLKPAFENFLEYAKGHAAVIAEFGRFPHRNQVLNRRSTPAEQEYLEAFADNYFRIKK